MNKQIQKLEAEVRLLNLKVVMIEEEKVALSNLRHKVLEQSQDQAERLDRMLNKTIDAHEVTKGRLALYENEVGNPHLFGRNTLK
jgi:hypothetical protein